MEDTTIRLDKFLANAGVSSRREIKILLKTQNLTVNGKRITESGMHIHPEKDIILLNGKKITKPGFVYFLLNKPMGYISTTADEYGRDNVISLIDATERIYPIGRLDKDTHGLLILTNDGEITHKLTHPRYHVPKVYRLIIAGKPTERQLELLRTGIMLEDGITLPAEVQVLKTAIPHSMRDLKVTSTVLITLHEGRNRQIRRMCDTVGIDLLDLERIAFGPIKLGSLPTGEYRKLSEKEIAALKKATLK